MQPKLTENVGKISGNRRLDASELEEPDQDDQTKFDKWLGGGRKVGVKRLVNGWERQMNLFSKHSDLEIHMVGQSHIDCAWMWRFEQTRKKAQVTFKKAILHAKLFPDTYKFALSEPLLLEWIKEDNPQLFKEIQEIVKKGNIELVGGSYVEPDCMMPSGEAMVRQRLYGMRFFRDNFGILPKVEWFLDSFGYNIGLPQILAKSGAHYFWSSKLTWNLQTLFPFVNFWWQSPDGSTILTGMFHQNESVIGSWKMFENGRHLLKDNGQKIWNYSYNYDLLGEHVKNDICPVVGYFFGWGDGGHGPTHKEVAVANELVKYDMFKWSGVEEFYKRLESYSEHFPIWNDEMYLENHRGCFSNHAEVKRQNRKYETLILSLEKLAVLTSLFSTSLNYPCELFEKLWKITLKNHFHDVLPGSSIPEVYDEVWDDWQKQKALSESILDYLKIFNDSQQSTEKKQTLLLFNPLSWDRNSRVFIPIDVFPNPPGLDSRGKPNYAKISFHEAEKGEFICQPVPKDEIQDSDTRPPGWWTILPLKSLSLSIAKLKLLNDEESRDLESRNPFETETNSIKSDSIKLVLDSSNGAIIQLKVKGVNNGKNLLNGDKSNLTFGFLDDDKSFPAWNLTPKYWEHPLDLSNDINVQITHSENGSVFSTLEIQKEIANTTVKQKITLFKNNPEVFFEYNTDWQKETTMLKILYSTSTQAIKAKADAMYCAIEFNANPEVPCDKARYEKICHQYCDVSAPDDSWGLALLNEGKYAFDVNSGDIRLTLLRSCKYPPPAPEAWVIKERKLNEESHNHKVPVYSGLGPFRCRYALFPHNGGALIDQEGKPNSEVKRKAEEFNNPVIVLPVKGDSLEALEEFNGKPLISVNCENIFVSALKFNEWGTKDTIIMRVCETSGISTDVQVAIKPPFNKKIKTIKPVDLLEREVDQEVNWNSTDFTLNFKIGKFEICTFELYLN